MRFLLLASALAALLCSQAGCVYHWVPSTPDEVERATKTETATVRVSPSGDNKSFVVQEAYVREGSLVS